MADYSTWKVVELQKELRKRGIPTSGLRNKEQYIEKLMKSDTSSSSKSPAAEASTPGKPSSQPSRPQPQRTQPPRSQASHTLPAPTSPLRTQPPRTQSSLTQSARTQVSRTQQPPPPPPTSSSQNQPPRTQPSRSQPPRTQQSPTQTSRSEASHAQSPLTSPSKNQPPRPQSSRTEPSRSSTINPPAQAAADTKSTFQLSVAIYDVGNPYRHWALYVETKEKSGKHILHVTGSAGNFKFENKQTDARYTRSFQKALPLCSLPVSKIADIDKVAKEHPIRGDRGFDCQTYVLELLQSLEKQGILDENDEEYQGRKDTVMQNLDGLV